MDAFLVEKSPTADDSSAEDEAPAATAGRPRLRVPIRDQVEMHCAAWDELLEPDHPARTVWTAVCGWDLSRWSQAIKAVEGGVGRDATDPRLLIALWVYAALEGVGSARELARLCEKHLAYQWLCGGVTVNYHLLSDVRSQFEAAWDELLTQIVGGLMAQGLVTMTRVAQDGMRVRAAAGKSSFRRRATLDQCLKEAREQVETLRRLADESPDELSKRQRTDSEQLPPMLEQLKRRYGRAPEEAVVDGGFASREAIRSATLGGVTVYAPLKQEAEQLAAGKNPYLPKRDDDEPLAAWRKRMGTEAAKLIYRRRAQTAEWVNAGCRNRGLWQMPVRGRPKCRIIGLLHAITHNLMQAVKLRRASGLA